MAIIQISKIQARSGNLVDLPQLDEAEFGWASDTKQLFIGKTTPNENIEILTSFSDISFSQLNGSVGNLSINPVNIDNGQVLAYNGVNWVNRGGKAGGLITLGDVSNVKINGGAIGFVLETDGTGNLAWTPKSAVIAFIENVTNDNPAVVTTTTDNFFPDEVPVTITDAPGMTELNGNTYIAKILTSRTFELFEDATTPLDSSGFTPYAFTSATETQSDGTVIVGSNDQFSISDPVRFVGDVSNTGLENDVTYFVESKSGSTEIRVTETLNADGTPGTPLSLIVRTGMTASVYVEGGRAISAAGTGAGGSGIAGGSQGTIQFNDNGLSNGKATFTFSKNSNQLTLAGDANVQNLNASGNIFATRFFSNVANGTAPLQVQSKTPVANLHSEKATVAVKSEVNSASTGNYFPVFGNSLTGNIALLSNSNLVFNAGTGELTVTKLKSTTDTNIEGNASVLGDTDISGNLNLTLDANFEANLVVENATVNSLFITDTISAENVSATEVEATTLSGVLVTNAQPNITSVGELTSLEVIGDVNANGNITTNNANLGNLVTANFFAGDGSLLFNLDIPDGDVITSGNSEVRVDLNGDARFRISGVDDVFVVSNTSATLAGDLIADTFVGDGSSLTDLDADNITSGILDSDRLSGNYSISVSSADTLSTPRNINGTAFDGSGNITTATWGTARNITIGSTSRSVNGSQNVSWTLADIGAAPAGNYLTSVNLGRNEGTTSVTITNSAGTDTTIRDATTSRAGLVTTGNQTWGGTKTAVNFVASSDERLKDNIESLNIDECLNTVLSLRPASYTWKINGEYDTGLIAQEVDRVIPHKVHKSEDGTLALSYSKLVTELIGAVQAQNKIINELKEQVEELKGNNNSD